MTRPKSMDLTEFFHYMDDGDPGAEQVIFALLDAREPTKMINALNRLDDLNIRGSELWNLYSRECHGNVEAFFKKVEEL